MKFISTRGQSPAVSASEAIMAGLAPDGGLYVPESFPVWNGGDFDAASILSPFFKGDVLESHLSSICNQAFNFKIPLKNNGDFSVLELFHGPTAAFKDVGARFLSECQSHLVKNHQMVMVATSGDTGGAVAAAFYGKPNTDVIILFPKGMVSDRQKKQLTCWGGNVKAYSVRGTFDDCQRMVKEAFADPRWNSETSLTSANSINVGRLLPQMTYYARVAAEHFQNTGRKCNFIIPSGNLGNAVAALWAKRMGLPIDQIVMSTNSNQAIGDYLKTGTRNTHKTIATLANAMDVGNPSNLERAIHLIPVIDEFRKIASSISVTDDEITATISKWATKGEIWCPHTATAVFAWEQINRSSSSKESSDWVVAATAHPAKFETIVEPLIGKKIDVPDSLNSILSKESIYQEINATLSDLI